MEEFGKQRFRHWTNYFGTCIYYCNNTRSRFDEL